ncbi:MAG: hypothetical protein KAS32_16470 [Candidatus Peribacteraceae bacterium]|nr:hypothetical protein [Candidatus Peribacteraceae bacterium]
MRCDLNCFQKGKIQYCCHKCPEARKGIKEQYKDLWSDSKGFWSENGCRLGEDRPQECKDYNCKDYHLYIIVGWNGSCWQKYGSCEVPIENINQEFVNKYNELFREYR